MRVYICFYFLTTGASHRSPLPQSTTEQEKASTTADELRWVCGFGGFGGWGGGVRRVRKPCVTCLAQSALNTHPFQDGEKLAREIAWLRNIFYHVRLTIQNDCQSLGVEYVAASEHTVVASAVVHHFLLRNQPNQKSKSRRKIRSEMQKHKQNARVETKRCRFSRAERDAEKRLRVQAESDARRAKAAADQAAAAAAEASRSLKMGEKQGVTKGGKDGEVIFFVSWFVVA